MRGHFKGVRSTAVMLIDDRFTTYPYLLHALHLIKREHEILFAELEPVLIARLENYGKKSTPIGRFCQIALSGRKIAWGSSKIFPRGRYSGQKFLDL